MTMEFSQTQLSALIEHLNALADRYGSEAVALLQVSKLSLEARRTALERLEALRSARELFDLLTRI